MISGISLLVSGLQSGKMSGFIVSVCSNCRWSGSEMFFEDAAEVGGILKAETVGDICYGHIGGFQHLVSFLEALGAYPFGGRLTVGLLEISFESGEAAAAQVSEVFQRHRAGVILFHHAVKVGLHRLMQLEHLILSHRPALTPAGRLHTAAPAFFQDADNSQRLFKFQDIDAGLELVSSTHGVNIVVELLDATLVCLFCQITGEASGFLSKDLILAGGILADCVRLWLGIDTRKALYASYPVLAIGNIRWIVNLWTRPQWYVDGAAEEMGQAYADGIAALQHPLVLVLCVVLTAGVAVLSIGLAGKVDKKSAKLLK